MAGKKPQRWQDMDHSDEPLRHGDRQEIRRLWSSAALREYLDWPGVQQVCRIARVVTYQESEPRKRVMPSPA